MKRFITFIIMLICLLSFAVIGQAATTQYYYDGEWHNYYGNTFKLKVNGEVLDTEMPPIVFDDYSVVPVRDVFEKLGATVVWYANSQQIDVYTNETMLKLKINSKVCYINGKTSQMQIAPKIINGKTMIPVRFVGENLGYIVDFDSSSDTVIVNSNIATPAPTPAPTAAPTPKPTAAPTAKPNTSTTNNLITSVTYTKNKDGIVLTLKTNKAASVSPFYLENPLRLVMDVPDFSFSTMPEDINIGGKSLKTVRFGHYNGGRIVFDLEKKLPYKINKTTNKIVITVGSESESQTGKDPVAEPTAKPTTPPVKKEADRSVTIDAGHGGSDVGAVGYDEDGNAVAYEKDFNLDVALRLEKELLKHNIKVHMIRDTDVYVDYQKVGSIANQEGSTLFVSVHTNSALANDATGIETFAYFSEESASINGMTGKRLAEIIQNELIYVTKAVDRGVKNGNTLAVIRSTSMPAVLVEMGFISNEEDRNKLMDKSYRQKIAEAIADGILIAFEEMGI